VVGPVVAALAMTGCAASPHRGAVVTAARSFVADVARHDGQAACSLLTDDARSSATGATDASCADAVLGVRAHADRVSGVQVWGDAAEVRFGSDVLFLRLVSGHWRVSAAGCTRQPVGPYDCRVGG
jgi:hypothetical protein